MKKKCNCYGFSLLETLNVAIFIVSVLLILYTQYIVLQKNYDDAYHYNSVVGVYKTKQIVDYLNTNEAGFVVKNVTSDQGFIDISSCENVENGDYCSKLFDILNIKTVLVADNDLNGLKSTLYTSNIYTEDLYDFVKKIDTHTDKMYRVVVEYSDGELSSLNLGI